MNVNPDVDERRIVVVTAGERVDLSAPAQSELGEALQAVGITIAPPRHLLIDSAGQRWDPTSLLDALTDGSVISVVDVSARPPSRRPTTGAPGRVRAHSSGPWWVLATLTVMLTAAALAQSAGVISPLSAPMRWAASATATATAITVATVVLRARGRAVTVGGAPMLVPLLMAFGAGVVATPPVYQATHVAITVGWTTAALLASAVSAMSRDRVVRSAAGTAAVILLALAGVWGLTVALGAGVHAAAAISVGLAAPALRLLPATLFTVPDGHAISYRHFMHQRWSVRQHVPDDVGEVTMASIRPYVDESTARLTVGTVLISVVTVAMTALMVPGVTAESLVVRIGTIVALTATVLYLVLAPRRHSASVLRWAPRLAAAAMVIAMTIVGAIHADVTVRLITAGMVLLTAVATAALLPLVSGRPVPLIWSRLGDAAEVACVVIALPSAVVAAGTLELVRAMVSG